MDLTQLSNQTYLIITTLGSNEAKNDQSLHLIWYDLNKNSNKILELSFGPDSLAYDSVNNYIFASDGNSIVKLNDTGKILNKINLDLKPSQISFVNSSFLLFVYYENNLTHLELVLVSVGIVILIVLILKYKKINFRSRKIY